MKMSVVSKIEKAMHSEVAWRNFEGLGHRFLL